MNVFGIGVDLVEVNRIEEAVRSHGERFLDRVFTAGEQAYCLGLARSGPSLAARFAAKEAVAKALGTGIGKEANLLDIEVLRGTNGAPEIGLSGRAAEFARQAGITRVLISLSHTAESAVAQAVAVRDI